MQRAYWGALNELLDQTGGPVSGARKPQLKPWMRYPIGKSGFNLGAAMAIPKRHIRIYLYIAGSKPSFHLLREQADEIERELGYSLDWKDSSAELDNRVSVYLNDLDPRDEEDWPRQHEWLVTKLNDMYRVFAHRVKALDPDEWQPEGESNEETATMGLASSSSP